MILGIVEVMLDAKQRYGTPLTTERLFGWHAALSQRLESARPIDSKRASGLVSVEWLLRQRNHPTLNTFITSSPR